MVPIRLDGVLVYGVLAGEADGVRVKVSVDEAERLGLQPGRQVRVETPGHTATFLLAAADDVPPFVFLRLRPLSRVPG